VRAWPAVLDQRFIGHVPHRHPAPTGTLPGTCGNPAGGGLLLSLTAGAAPACAIAVTNNTAFTTNSGGNSAGGGGIWLFVPPAAVLDFKNGLQQVGD
jgi:hypothetical protein